MPRRRMAAHVSAKTFRFQWLTNTSARSRATWARSGRFSRARAPTASAGTHRWTRPGEAGKLGDEAQAGRLEFGRRHGVVSVTAPLMDDARQIAELCAGQRQANEEVALVEPGELRVEATGPPQPVGAAEGGAESH